MSKIIGIDFGTTNSCVAVLENGKPIIIPNAEGDRTTPSVVAVTKENERLIGRLASNQATTNPDNTVIGIKRYMGYAHNVKMNNKNYIPQEVASMILEKLKLEAEQFLCQKVHQVVITVPESFNEFQRQAIRDACRIAGLTLLRIINDTAAVGLVYGMNEEKDMTVIVFDLGGSTFNVSVIETVDGVIFVKYTMGNNFIGGEDFDQRIIDWMITEFERKEGIHIVKDNVTVKRLREAAEKAKIELSNRMETDIHLPYITTDVSEHKHLILSLTRDDFNKITIDLLGKTLLILKEALLYASIRPEDVDSVLLVGGSTRIPAIQEMVERVIGKKSNKKFNQDEVVAAGAAIQAGILSGELKDITALDITSFSLGIETLGGAFTEIIIRNTTIPTRIRKMFTTSFDNQRKIEIHVLQGEREMAAYNLTLGKFELAGIPPAPKGFPKIEITIEINGNGIIYVSAKELSTRIHQDITITALSNLTKEKAQSMVDGGNGILQSEKKCFDTNFASSKYLPVLLSN